MAETESIFFFNTRTLLVRGHSRLLNADWLSTRDLLWVGFPLETDYKLDAFDFNLNTIILSKRRRKLSCGKVCNLRKHPFLHALRSSRNVPSGEERGETDAFAGYKVWCFGRKAKGFIHLKLSYKVGKSFQSGQLSCCTKLIYSFLLSHFIRTRDRLTRHWPNIVSTYSFSSRGKENVGFKKLLKVVRSLWLSSVNFTSLRFTR